MFFYSGFIPLLPLLSVIIKLFERLLTALKIFDRLVSVIFFLIVMEPLNKKLVTFLLREVNFREDILNLENISFFFIFETLLLHPTSVCSSEN